MTGDERGLTQTSVLLPSCPRALSIHQPNLQLHSPGSQSTAADQQISFYCFVTDTWKIIATSFLRYIKYKYVKASPETNINNLVFQVI